MRISECMFLLSIVFLLGGKVENMCAKNIKDSENLIQLTKKSKSIEFIPESFRNAVHGIGFTDLNEWKNVCGEMFSLNEVEVSKNGKLITGTWVGPLGNGIVYELEDR